MGIEVFSKNYNLKFENGAIKIKLGNDLILPYITKIKLDIKGLDLKLTNYTKFKLYLNDLLVYIGDVLIYTMIGFFMFKVIPYDDIFGVSIIISIIYLFCKQIYEFFKIIYKNINIELFDVAEVKLCSTKNRYMQHIYIENYKYKNDNLRLNLINKNDDEIILLNNIYYFEIVGKDNNIIKLI